MAVLGRTLGRAQSKVQAKVQASPQANAETGLNLGPILLLAIGAIVVVALLQLVQTSDAAISSFAIQKLEQEKLELRTGISQLEGEIARLQSLARIEEEAARLDLVPPLERRDAQVNVPQLGDQRGLPSRFAPEEGPESDAQGQSWWRDLLNLLPF